MRREGKRPDADTEISSDVDAELAFHVAETAARLRAAGLSPDAARRRAESALGDLGTLKRELVAMDTRAARRTIRRERWGRFVSDLRYGARMLRRRPVSALVAVLTLGLGVGGTAAVAGAAWSMLLRPLPYAEADELVAFWSAGNWSRAEFEVARDATSEWASVAAHAPTQATVRRSGEASRVVPAERVTGGLFDVLRVPAARGRTLRAEDGLPGAARVVVLSDGLWRDGFGADASLVGRTITVDGEAREVVGIMPPAFAFPDEHARLWLPVTMDAMARDHERNHYLSLVARLSSGVDLEAALTRLPQLGARLRERFNYSERFDKGATAALLPLRVHLRGDPGTALTALAVSVLLVLLIAAANVAGLQLGRLAERRGEIAVRKALGASRGRLVAQILTEGLLTGLLAGVVAVVLLGIGLQVAGSVAPVDALAVLRGSTPVLPFAVAALSVSAGLVVGLLPALRVVRRDVRAGLAEARGGIGGHLRAHGFLVSAELGVAVTLVLGASVLVASVLRLSRIDTGIDAAGVVVVDVFAGDGDLDTEQRRAFLTQATDRVARLPGVRRAATVQLLPLRSPGWSVSVATPDRPELGGVEAPVFFWRAVTPGFHEALGIGIVEGRGFTEADRSDARPVAIVGRAAAQVLWPDGRIIGRRITTGVDGGAEIEVVGVAEDIRVSDVRADAEAVVYRPVAQVRIVPEGHTLIVRAAGEPMSIVPSLRATLEATEPRVAIARIETMQAVVRATFADVTRATLLLVAFAGLALALGALGVYGVASQWVSRRTREYGLRLALGASSAQIRTSVLRQAVAPVAGGIVLGLVAFALLARLLRAFVYATEPSDPLLLAGCVTLLAVVALAALYAPARRAARTDPVRALNAD